MNTNTLKNTLRFLPYWTLTGGVSSCDIEYAKCSVTITGQMLSFQQAREFLPALQKALSEVSFDEPIPVKGFVREIKKLASYHISVTEGNDTMEFPLIERLYVSGSNPKAYIRLEPMFFSLLTGGDFFFDESIAEPEKSRISWVFSRLSKVYGESKKSIGVELLGKFVSADMFDVNRWLKNTLWDEAGTVGNEVPFDILTNESSVEESVEDTPDTIEAPVNTGISLKGIAFEDARADYLGVLEQPTEDAKVALREIASLLKKDKTSGKQLENALRKWGYDRKKKAQNPTYEAQDPLVPALTLQAIDLEAVTGNPLLTPFTEFVNEKLVQNGVSLCSGASDIVRFNRLKSLIVKYGATLVVESAKKYIIKNPGKGAEWYAFNNIEREAMILAGKK